MQAADLDFLIIGAAKSATTWLQKSLQADPAISMPEPELHYFSRYHHRGDRWYFDQFPKVEGDKLVGEKSNSYLDAPQAPARVHALLPHAKLVVQLRNPVDRAYSDYCMLYRRGEVDRRIERHLDTGSGRASRLLAGGLYHEQLQAYLDLYPAERLLILLFEDMIDRPAEQLARVRAFLGLPPANAVLTVGKKVKDKTVPMIGPRLRKMTRPLKPLARPLRQNPVFAAVRGVFAREIVYPPLSSDMRMKLAEFYTSDVERLGSLVNRDLSSWLKPAGGTPLSK